MKRVLFGITLAVVAAVLGYFFCKISLGLAGTRIYHPDECANIFAARTLALRESGTAAPPATLFLAPFAWLAKDATRSTELFASARLVSLLIFWLNVVLIAASTGSKLLSGRGLAAMIGAATLAPLWDFGFEVRPENLLLTGLLLTWCVVRYGNPGVTACVVVGALAVATQCSSWQAIIYTLPLTGAYLAFSRTNPQVPRWRLAAAWLGGAVGMWLLLSICFGALGLQDTYFGGLPLMASASTGGDAVDLWRMLGRLLGQIPLLLALLVSACVATFVAVRRQGRAALASDACLPEALLWLLAFVALLLNPTPRPGEVLIPAVFAYLLVFRYAIGLAHETWQLPLARPLILTLLVFAHFVPFWMATRRQWLWTNYRQEGLMSLADRLTSPAEDTVYDGVGLVPTRRSPQLPLPKRAAPDALRSTGFRDLISTQPPAVLIRNHRNNWLWEQDGSLIREHYVPLAEDFWVLGRLLPVGGGSVEIIHPGRYRISSKEISCIFGTVEKNSLGLVIPAVKTNCVGTVDGVPLSGKPIELTVGTHRIETSPDCEPAIVWLGPKLDRLQPQGDSDYRQLFVNWY